MSSSTLPLDPSFYVWEQDPSNPLVWERPTLAGESMWHSRTRELHSLFICSTLTFNPPILRQTFHASTKSAWSLLRYSIPELEISARSGNHGKSFMQYQTPSPQAANVWISRTYSFQNSNQSLDFEDLRKSIVEAKQRAHDEDNAFLLSHAVLDVEDEDGDVAELVKHAQIMVYVDHQVADGIGCRILLGNFLTLLASELGRAPSDAGTDIKWEDSWKNLSPPWICLMNSEQVCSGPEYEEIAAKNRDIILNKLKQNPGLPILSNPSHDHPPNQETHFITLTAAQTTSLLNAIKNVVSPASNITHLGHAAMILALLRSIQLPTSTGALYSPCWLNGRRYLNDPELVKNHVPICQSFAPIVFSELQDLTLPNSAGKEEIKEKLVEACKIATTEYGKIKMRKSMLPECVVLFEELVRNMAFSTEQNKPNASHENESGTKEQAQTADPFFLSDGITEQYISHTYPALSSKPLITVDDVQFAAHAERNLIVRMSSWRGRTTISGEWRECDFDREMVVNFLNDVVEIMMSIVDEDMM